LRGTLRRSQAGSYGNGNYKPLQAFRAGHRGSDKRLDAVMRVTDLDTVELEDGKIKGADTLKSSIEKEWADFIVKTDQKGADTKNPLNNVGGETMTRAEIAALPDREARREARLKLLQNEQ
jgi:hypothetical protein